MNAGLLIEAGRVLSARGLTVFSTLQLFVVTAISLQRALVLQPALATQRHGGRYSIPRKWILRISLPIAIITAAIVPSALGSPSDLTRYLLTVLAACALLAADVLRFALYSTERAALAMWLDMSATVLLGGWLVVRAVMGPTFTWESLVLGWSLVTGAVCVTGLLLFSVGREGALIFPSPTIRQVLVLGKWSGLDALMSGVANLGPFVAAGLILKSDIAGLYRLMQAAQGPLNILTTAIITSFGLDAWQYQSREQVDRLARKVRRLFLLLGAFAVAYLGVAEAAIVLLTGVRGHEVLRVGLILALSGVIGGASIAWTAGANILGQQKWGFGLRTLVIALSVILVFAVRLEFPIPWNDPIGCLALLSASINLVGWYWAFRTALHRERDTGTSEAGGRAQHGRLARRSVAPANSKKS